MRFISGVIIGIALTIGGAYFHDQSLPSDASQRLVNWTVAGELARNGATIARNEFDRLMAK
jgi:hypothetical protein